MILNNTIETGISRSKNIWAVTRRFFQQYCSIDENIAEALDYSESWFEQKFTLFCQSLCRQNAYGKFQH